MKIEGNQVILEKEAVSDWLCYELEQVHNSQEDKIKLNYHQDMIEGALGVLGLPPYVFQKIYTLIDTPTDVNIFRAYQAVIREFGPSEFNFWANLGRGKL